MTQYVIGVDIGGTCTDCVVIDDEGDITLAKAFSTPPDFSRGIMDVLGIAARELGIDRDHLLANTRLFLHSTTVAENAVVDETLATAGVLTTAGFEDTLLAMRGGYGRWSGLTEEEKRNPVETHKPPPIVPRDLVEGVRERTDANGRILREAADDEIEAAIRRLFDAGVEALGVSFLWAFANPRTELRVREIVERLRPGTFLTLSHEIAPIIGEYERTSTVALNARLGPVVGSYLENLGRGLEENGFNGILLVAQAYGGLLPFEKAAESPVGMIESGPGSGLIGCQRLGERMGLPNIIAADVGGTTFKVGVIRDGLTEYQRESMVLRYHYALPKLDIVSLGLAGGSVISVDERTGTPHVGPRSAGSYPGPVCYGHGGEEPTITDVDAILGYLNPAYFLGGRESLDLDKARDVFERKVAEPLGMPVIDAAAAIYELANSLFFDLLHKTTVESGLDPRGFALFSFGGTAGMHVAAYGEQLGVARIVIPHSASVHGAFGLTTSNIVHEDQITRPMRQPFVVADVATRFTELEDRLLPQLRDEGFEDGAIRLRRSIDMRYRRQVHILTVPVDSEGSLDAAVLDGAVERFEQLYREKYGAESAYREAGVELVSFRVRGEGVVEAPDLRVAELTDSDCSRARVATVNAWVEKAGEMRAVDGYDFELMAAGHALEGPAIIWTPITTLVIGEGQRLEVDENRSLVITPDPERPPLGRRLRRSAAA